MNRQLIYRILVGGLLLLFPFITQAQVTLKNWVIEDHSSETQIMVFGDMLDITAPKDLTLWYNKRLTGDYETSCRIKALMQGGKYDRLNDLNRFWGASDPEHPENLHVQTAWRKSIFQHYKFSKLFYMGYGGNHNSTTRSRQYYGGGPSLNDSIVRSVIKKYTDPAHLLFPNQWYHTQIRVQKGITTYRTNGEELFRLLIKHDEGDGHFGLRLLQNRVLFIGFRIKNF